MTSSTTGDRRWGTTRRSGMTILGKVAVPKPINLPSQRLENQGLDPNVEIVPKGTLSWGTKSSLNAWGSSSLSPRTESGAGSPSQLNNRPSSGGSVTRPSTAGSDKAHESSSIARDSNSRPSSASGVFPSKQASVALQRPHSADTRPGSSHLSRVAEAASENSASWGQHVAPEKLGVGPTKNDAFSLTCGDFPSLGAKNESSEKSKGPQDSGPCTRPASSSGRSVEERGVDYTEGNVRIGDANAWRIDNQPYSDDAPRHCREEGQSDSRCSQSYPNANFPNQFDAWRGPLVNSPQGGVWYGGNHPYGGAPIGPGGFHMDPFPFYPTQVPPVPGQGTDPRGNHATNGKMFRPPTLDSYVHPRMQTRSEFYRGPVPYNGYYGPPLGYGDPSNRDLPFACRPTGPHAYNKHSGQSGNAAALEHHEPSHSQETQKPYKVLLKPQSRRFGEDESKREKFPATRLPNAEKVAQQVQTSKNNRRDTNEATGKVQPIKAENDSPEDRSLIQKIEGLNAKTRSNDGRQKASSLVNRDEQVSKSRTVNSGNSVNHASARISRTGHGSDSEDLLHYKQSDPARNKNADLAVIDGTSISRRPTQQTQGGADHQTKQRVNNEGNDVWRKTTVTSGSSSATVAASSESFTEVIVSDSLNSDSIGKPGSSPLGNLKDESGISADPIDNQRSTMRELARQRAQQRQKEEEERARDQRAKALAKLEELNRRSQVTEDASVKNMEAASNAYTPGMPENNGSVSPALMPSNSDDVHVRSSLEMKTTIATATSKEPTGESGKTSMQGTMASEYANNIGPTQQGNLPRDHEGAVSKQKRLGYKQKQNIVFEKKVAANSFSVATSEVDVVPSPEVVNEGVLSHNSGMPAASSISTESTLTKRKNNRNGKKKHKVEETTKLKTTGGAIGKETKLGDESIETCKTRAAEMELGSVSVPSLDIKVSGNSSEQISSFSNEESKSRTKSNLKSQHLGRTQRNSPVTKPGEKFPGSNAVIWAPIHPQQKGDISTGVGSQHTVPKFDTSLKCLHQGQTSSKSKRVEIERYVAKPIVKEIAEQIVSKNLIADPEMMQKENCGGEEGTGIVQPSGSTAGKSESKSRHRNGRQVKHGREHGSPHQRGSAASTKALEDGQFVTSNQPIRGTVNYHSDNQSNQVDVGPTKDQNACNDDGWNDGWFMTPETHYSTAVGMEASGPQAGAVLKDQGVTSQGKRHASRSNKDRVSNYSDPKKANKRDSNKAHMHHTGHDLPVASTETRVPGDDTLHTTVAPSINRTGKNGGRVNSRDKTYGSQKKNVARYEHQGFTTEQKITSADTQAQSQNRYINKDVQVEQNPNSTFQKNSSQSRRFGRGQEPQGGWGLSVQENMNHHNQRPASNRDRQKQYLHYEYKPVGSHTDREHREQLKDSSQTEGQRYREKGQGHQNHGHGLTGERN